MSSQQVEPKVICDLCKLEINTEKPWPQMMYPFAEDQRDKMAAALAERIPIPFGNILGIVRALPPITYHRFDFHAGCADGFLPMLDELREIAYREQLSKLEDSVKKRAPEVPDRYE